MQEFRTPWTDRLARDPHDRAAQYALATADRLTYALKSADSLYRAIVARDSTDAWATHARLGMANALASEGSFGGADTAYTAVLQHLPSNARALRADALIRLAMVRARTVGPRDASRLLRQAARVRPPGDSLALARLSCTRAALAVGRGAPTVLPDARLGVRITHAADDPRLEATCRHVIARDYIRRGEVDSALMVLRVVDSLQRRGGNRAGRAATLQWSGYLLTTLAEYGRARRLLVRAVTEGEASHNLSPVAWAYGNLAEIALRAQNLDAAIRYADHARRLYVSQHDLWGLANVRAIQGDIALRTAQYDSAAIAYGDALRRNARLGDADAVFAIRTALLELAIARRDWRGARAQLDSAALLVTRRGMQGWQGQLDAVRIELAVTRGDMAAARRTLARYLPEQHEPLRRYRALAEAAYVAARTGNLGAAERDLRHALGLLDRWRATLDPAGLRAYAFAIAEYSVDTDLHIPATLAALARGGRAAAAFELAERERAREMFERMVRTHALESRHHDRSLPRAVTGPGSPATIMAALPNDSTALIEYVTGVGNEPTTAFVLTRHALHAVVLPPATRITDDVRRFVALLAAGDSAPRLAAALGQAVLDSATALLPPTVTRLVVVPDGVLHLLPFDLLRLRDGASAITAYALSFAPSASVAAALWHHAARTGPAAILAFGNPTMPTADTADPGHGSDLERMFAETGGLAPLPGSAVEARLVADFGPSATLRLGDSASEGYLLHATLRRYAVIHFATHAIVDQTSITRTALALAPGRHRDGFVTPGALESLHLDADLVFLSGCRTAGGVWIRGEGVSGLTTPLLEAGARAVVATMRPLRDRAALPIVRAFYLALASGRTVGDALRLAKLSARAAGTPPAVWSTFELIGDPSVRIGLTAPHDGAWMKGAIAAVIALAGSGLAWTLGRRRPTARESGRG